MIEITDINSSGMGVGRQNGVVVFVPYTITGEQVEMEIISTQKNYMTGKVSSIHKAHPERRTAPCPYYGLCGGCNLMHMNYSQQISAKESIVKTTLERIGKIECKINPMICAKSEVNYRNKAAFPVKDNKIGYYHSQTHSIVAVEKCPLVDENINNVLWAMKPFVKSYGNGITHIVVRSIHNRTMVIAVTNLKNYPYERELVKALSPLNIHSININYNTNPKHILGKQTKTVFGYPTIPYTIMGNTFDVSPTSFLQVNTSQTQKLYNTAISLLDLSDKQVIDAYCGIGTISLALARQAKKVIGIELNPDAISNAKASAKINRITNAEFICAKCEDSIPKLLKGSTNKTVLFADPPRSGMDKNFINAIVASDIQDIVYISCNPATLSRDILLLSNYGYTPVSITPIDMFPNTAHVECIVLLSKR